MPYKLSASLIAHTSDVRGLSSPNNNLVLSASRDATAIVWRRSSPDQPFTPSSVLKASSQYVNAVVYIPPTPESPEGCVATGGQDAIINVYSLSSPKDDPDHTLVGHTANVCTLDVTPKGGIISGSWDATAKLWMNFVLSYELKGHQQSVLAVLALDEEEVLTGSADKTIKIWHKDKVLRTFTGHHDVVRSLAKISSNGFASCSNDSEVRIWSFDGDLIHTLAGHTSFVYSLSILPNGDVVSSGEDRTVRIWKDGNCFQVIVHPAISVWAVSTMPNGDIVSGSSDGIVRIFSCDKDRWAQDEVMKAYDAAVANQSLPSHQVGDVKASDLPDLGALSIPGGKPGEVKMIRNGSIIEAHQWDSASSTWQKIGDVVDAVGQGRRQLYQGKEYDYVFDVDIQEGAPPLKLPYNITENPFSAAQKFLQSNNLPLSYIDEVVNFIRKNTSGVSLGSGEEYVDPFTGASRYRSSPAAPAPDPSVSTSTLKIIPARNFVPFKQANISAMQIKLHQFDEALRDEISTASLAMGSQESSIIGEIFIYLLETTENSSQYRSTSLNVKHVKTLIQILDRWPSPQRFPVIDLSRLLTGFCFEAFEAPDIKEQFLEVLFQASEWNSSWSTPLPKSSETNILLSLRTLANMFQECTSLADEWVGKLFGALDLEKCISLNKAQRVALSTMLFNLSCAGFRIPLKKGLLDNYLALLLGLLQSEVVDSEVAYRTLVGLGNTLHIAKGKETTIDAAWCNKIQCCLQTIPVSFPEGRIRDVVGDIAALLYCNSM